MKCKYQSAGKYVLILMVFCVALFLLLWNRSLDLKVVLGGTLLSAAYCGVFFYSVQRILRTDNKTVRYISGLDRTLHPKVVSRDTLFIFFKKPCLRG